jgi:hypothetical protein
MTDNNGKGINDFKEEERLKVEIPVEEYDAPGADKEGVNGDQVVNQLRDLGRQMGETLRTAWESEERKKVEGEVREGVNMFASELDKIIREVREGEAGQKMRSEASDIRQQVQSNDFGRKVSSGLSQALGWLGSELDKLSHQVAPDGKEKAPEDVTPDVEE